MRFRSDVLRHLRDQRGKAQFEVSAALGISRRTYVDYESGNVNSRPRGLSIHDPRVAHTIRAIGRYFGIAPAELLEPTDGTEVPAWALPDTETSDRNLLHCISPRNIELRLDRAQQWNQLIKVCERDQHASILLTGEQGQQLQFFLERTRLFLDKEVCTPHRIITVKARDERKRMPVSGEEWRRLVETNLTRERDLVAAATSQESLFGTATDQAPLLVILGARPIMFLNEFEQDGLEEFLAATLPDLVRSRKFNNPFRFLISVDYIDRRSELVEKVVRWATVGESRGGPHFVELAPLAPPSWEDIRAFLENMNKPPDVYTVDRLRQTFEQLTAQGRARTFFEITNLLERFLVQA